MVSNSVTDSVSSRVSNSNGISVSVNFSIS